MSYKIEKEKNSYNILEVDTDTTVYATHSMRDARRLCRSLNLGSGFNGFTPLFFAVTNKKGDS